MRRFVCGLAIVAGLSVVAGYPAQALQAQQAGGGEKSEESTSGEPKTIEEMTEGMLKLDGFVPIYWNEKDGKLWLEISRFDTDILHYTSLPAGFGENTLGLNRGDLGPSHVIQWKRVGPRILMTEANQRYRASTDNAMERKSVDDGFPQSVHWGFTVAAETDGRVLVDATDFFMNDWHGIIQSLKRSKQGTFKLDKSRSAAYLPRTRAFPTNSEIEVTLTFTSDQPGSIVRSVAASAGAVTVRQHHSFVELPELGTFHARRADPRAGFGAISYMDYSVPIGEPLRQRFARRHRLEKVNPDAASSPAVEPIVYYLDPGTPEPVRTALLEGGQWWNQAFTAAGYENAFRMEILPDSADPMDARYNVVQWVHRSTRGWSYGGSISDPRTGEILKGHVTLGSLRVRQDYLIAEAMLSPYEEDGSIPNDMAEMALLRIRQLSAHEIGHTLGLAHNYIASTQRDAGNMSVMDYPHPRVELVDGEINVLNAYERGIGEWDKTAITWGYQDFPNGTDEKAALDHIISEARDRGVTFITDQDARPQGSAHPQAHLWDNGRDAASELDRMMDVRRVALDRLSEKAIRMGQPMATIEEALVPLYLHHRFQTEAAVKVVGGMSYTYAMRGDGQTPITPVSGGQQRRALHSVLATLDPGALVLPEDLLRMIPPRPFGYGLQPELFRRYTGLVFDAVAPAAAAADMTVSLLLNPQRAARLVEQSARDDDLPSFLEVAQALLDATISTQRGRGYPAEVGRAVDRVVVDRMMRLAQTAAMPQVRAEATMVLSDLRGHIVAELDGMDGANRAHRMLIASDIQRWLHRPMETGSTPGVLAQPPGSPIGDPGLRWGGVSLAGPLQLEGLVEGLVREPGLECSWH
jgi:Met-zincin/Domain of unknown function (DUF5117)